ncbi:hypothetical protein T4D_10466 [Trichinella pseudospiralis]|uniref:Uncharacterized protein n=1 Tax=Trichinella pseudospiralis TaxID=6337 RepID=A0A0V1FF20_TRIPS|nr:hypothetical protein T4D_10466 [Trichinella pseudospiralis]
MPTFHQLFCPMWHIFVKSSVSYGMCLLLMFIRFYVYAGKLPFVERCHPIRRFFPSSWYVHEFIQSYERQEWICAY